MDSIKYLVFEGNIGSGKTSISTKYAEDLDTGLILERFEENQYLELFYKNPDRHALPLELWFMAERYKQLEDHFAKGDLFNQSVVSDYLFFKTLLFAKNNLVENEFMLFEKLFQIIRLQIPLPDLTVFLYRPIEVLLEQIRRRGRDYEADITAEYLENIQNQYDQFFKAYDKIKVLYVNLGDKDLLDDEVCFAQLKLEIDAMHASSDMHRIINL